MADPVRIPDASPLIVLAKVGRVDLLGPAMVIPQAVADEVLAGPEDDPARVLVESGRFESCPDVTAPVAVQEWGLGAGESTVLALAGTLTAASPVLRDLRSAGLWLDDALIAEVLRRALNEEWRP